MKQPHPIDDLFRRHLADSSVEPPAHLWASIARERRRRRHHRLLWWSGAAALCLSAVTVFLLWPSRPTLEAFAIAPEPEELPRRPAAMDFASIDLSPLPADREAAAGSNTSPAPVASPTAETPAPAGRTAGQVARRAGRIPTTPSPEAFLTLAPEAPTSTIARTPVFQLNTSLPLSALNNGPEEESQRILGPHQRDRVTPLTQLPTPLLLSEVKSETNLLLSRAPQCARFREGFFKLDLEVLAGPAYAFRQMRSNTVEGVTHLRNREATEMSRPSATAGLRLGITSKSGLGFRVGLAYTQLNERFEHFIGTVVDTMIQHRYDASGNIIATDTTWSSKRLMATRNNQLRFVEAPVLLSYERQWGKLRIGLNAGAYLNLVFDAEGDFLSPATAEPAPYGQEGEAGVLPIFRERITAGWYAGASVAYNLRSRFSIVAEPFIKSYPRELTSPAYDLQQNYWIAGLQVGMRMRL